MKNAIDNSVPLNIRSVLIVSTISVAYLLLSWWVVGYKPDQLVLILLCNTLFYASVISRKFVIGFCIFIFYWIIFDYMKAFPNYNYHAVHIADLYNFEKRLFGIRLNGMRVTPNEYLRFKATTFLNLLTGLFYLCWIPVPLSFAAYLFFTRKKQFLCFALTFLLVNLLGFIVYYLYPAAPPWYVEHYGFGFHPLTMGNTGGLAKFDAYFHAGIFQSIYSRGSNVFAAMPSLHSAYPVIVFYYGVKNRLGAVNILFGIVMFGIWFTAVYASHHYVVDVLAGIICAVTGITLFNILFTQIRFLKQFIIRYEALIR